MKKRALSVMETAVTVGIVVVIAVLAVGMFTDGLHGLIANGGSQKVITGENLENQTSYTTFNRDYSATQVEVQVTGEQGLEMLRKKANNKALDLINSDYNKKAMEIAYLSRVVEIITGESYFCQYMHKNSEKHCNVFSKYAYKASVSSTLTIPEKTDKALALDKASSILAKVNVPKDADGYPHYSDNAAENTKAKYEAISALSAELEEILSDKSVLLLSKNNLISHNIAVKPLNANEGAEGIYVQYFTEVVKKLKRAHDKCECSVYDDVPNIAKKTSECGEYEGSIGLFGVGFATSSDKKKMRADHRFVNNGSIEQFENAVKSIKSLEELKALLQDSNSALLEPVRRDNYHDKDKNACSEFNKAIESINLSPVTCEPYNSYDKW